MDGIDQARVEAEDPDRVLNRGVAARAEGLPRSAPGPAPKGNTRIRRAATGFMTLSGALLGIALAGLISSTVYLALVAIAACRFRARARGVGASASPPLPVSVLKPLHGDEPRLEECLESVFAQPWERFEVIFGARDPDDPAWGVVSRLQRKYPGVATRTVVSGDPVLPNPKVSSLVPMAARASFDYVVIADSDVRAKKEYLAEIVRPLVDRNIGLVTCLYRGIPTTGLGSRLDALGMTVEMSSGVLVADMLEGMRFALGPTVATRKDVLGAIGGIASLGAYCADDYVLGQRVHAAGKTVVLSHHVVDQMANAPSLRAFLAHQIRWMRSTRHSRPWGHIGSGLTFAMPFGLLGLLAAVSGGRWALGLVLVGWALTNRLAQCLLVGGWALRDRGAVRWAWLYPLRDLLGFYTWCASFAGAAIVWRGVRYELGPGGRMRRVPEPGLASASVPSSVPREQTVAVGQDARP